MPTLWELLEADHERVRALFRRIDRTSERGARLRERLWKDVVAEIRLHAKLEQMHLYPALRDADPTREHVLRADEEHRLAMILLEDVESVGFGDERWKAKFSVFRDDVERHALEEETMLFPLARKVLDREAAEAVAARIAADRTAALPRTRRPPRMASARRPAFAAR
jgi:hemerythrin-like domain-containing protein